MASIMKKIIILTLILITFKSYGQQVIEFNQENIECCQHLDKEFGETWSIMIWAKNEKQAQRIIKKYQKLNIANNYFESYGEYYIELIDPSDIDERIDKRYMIPKRLRKRIITVDFLVYDNGELVMNEENEKIILK
jgi:hypothetical protein